MCVRATYLGFGLLVIAACGSGKHDPLTDAPSSEDAGPTFGVVRVTVPDPDTTVVFINPDGTLVKQVVVDAEGKAEAEVMVGASVTAIHDGPVFNGFGHTMISVTAVKPGDDLQLGAITNTHLAGRMTVTFPPLPDATGYAVASPCGPADQNPPAGELRSFTLLIGEYCKIDPMEIVAIAFGSDGVIAEIDQTDVPFLESGTVSLTAMYEPALDFTASYTNIDPSVESIQMTRTVLSDPGVANFESRSSPAPAVAFSARVAATKSARVDTRATRGPQSSLSESVQQVAQNIAGTSADYALDVGATLLPWLGTATFDPASNKIVVPADMTGTSADKPDWFGASMKFMRDVLGKGHVFYDWTIYAPDAGGLEFPRLPDELRGLLPGASELAAQVWMTDAEAISGYDAFRNNHDNLSRATGRTSLSPMPPPLVPL